jgi:hypothetical protein
MKNQEYTFDDLIADVDPACFDTAKEYVEYIRNAVKKEWNRDLTVEEAEMADKQWKFVHECFSEKSWE